MSGRLGFDNERYLEQQSAAIRDRVTKSKGKLYLEFGGKLLFDYHAARVLPGFHPGVKMRLLQNLGDQTEVVLCIFAGDIEKKKMRADFGITYDTDSLKTIDELTEPRESPACPEEQISSTTRSSNTSAPERLSQAALKRIPGAAISPERRAEEIR